MGNPRGKVTSPRRNIASPTGRLSHPRFGVINPPGNKTNPRGEKTKFRAWTRPTRNCMILRRKIPLSPGRGEDQPGRGKEQPAFGTDEPAKFYRQLKWGVDERRGGEEEPQQDEGESRWECAQPEGELEERSG